jgi:hypothetical protein
MDGRTDGHHEANNRFSQFFWKRQNNEENKGEKKRGGEQVRTIMKEKIGQENKQLEQLTMIHRG